jgi:uncharacterized integral membrane protein
VIRKIVTALILVPLAIVLVVFAVANRQIVTVSFDPFNAAQPAFVATMPLFVLIMALLIFGVVVGGLAAWLRQSKWRSTARRLERDVRDLHDEVDALRRAQDSDRASLPVPLERPPPRMRLRPPMG